MEVIGIGILFMLGVYIAPFIALGVFSILVGIGQLLFGNK
jgi:hypothetical protein